MPKTLDEAIIRFMPLVDCPLKNMKIKDNREKLKAWILANYTPIKENKVS